MQQKNIYTDKSRNYRFISHTNNKENSEQFLEVKLEESDLYFLLSNKVDEKLVKNFIKQNLLKLRNEIKAFTLLYPEFEYALSPINFDKKIIPTPLISEMLYASEITKIGPFASVAGTIAEFLAKSLSNFLIEMDVDKDVLVENGGDNFIISSKKRIVALLDKPEKDFSIGLEIKPTKGLSICASSSTIGHSKSFGNAELVVILSKNAALADSMATAVCNKIKSANDFPQVLEYYKEKEKYGLVGIFASCDNSFLVYGDIQLTAL